MQQRELDVVQREISVLLKEKQVEESLGKKGKKKKRDSNIISRPRTFEHIVSVKPRDGGLQVSKKEITNSLLPISKIPFVASDNLDEPPVNLEHSKGLFGRLKKVFLLSDTDSIWCQNLVIFGVFGVEAFKHEKNIWWFYMLIFRHAYFVMKKKRSNKNLNFKF